jgi:hypothetical protein
LRQLFEETENGDRLFKAEEKSNHIVAILRDELRKSNSYSGIAKTIFSAQRPLPR